MSFIQTASGKHFDYLNASTDDVAIEDIATALSNICRFAGHLPEFYSVAQHSVLCSQIVPHEFAFEALLHAGIWRSTTARPGRFLPVCLSPTSSRSSRSARARRTACS